MNENDSSSSVPKMESKCADAKSKICTHKLKRKFKFGLLHEKRHFWCMLNNSEECNMPIKYTETRLAKHFQTYHSEPDDLQFSCNNCDMKFPIKTMLTTHIRRAHKKTFQCSKCDLTFYQMAARVWHEYSHRKVKDEEKQFKCRFCDYRAAVKFNRDGHEKRQHHASKHQFICDICGKDFIYKNKVTEHLRSHSNVKSFECNICSKQFKCEKGMRYHFMKAHGIKYACKICSKECSSPRALLLHERDFHDATIDLSNAKPCIPEACKIWKKIDINNIRKEWESYDVFRLHKQGRKDKSTKRKVEYDENNVDIGGITTYQPTEIGYDTSTNSDHRSESLEVKTIVKLEENHNQPRSNFVECPVIDCNLSFENLLRLGRHLKSMHQLE